MDTDGREPAAPTTDEAAGERRLPRPVKERWHPLRSGLVNLYRYDEEEFWFEQGRLLLRGNNGTGKSRVLALQLPFLLDGEIASHRVEPDGDRAKRMEWNLLMNRHPDRLGYTWVEFGRRSADGAEEFLTLGCGLRAVQGRGVDDRWFFVTPKRIGDDLRLVTDGRTPIGRDRLEQEVGRDRVYRSAQAHRRAVDDALFKLGPRYEALIELLIRLRQPQLSRHLDEAALSRALGDALPPLSPALVEETAEAFRGLEADREDLAAVRETEAAVAEFLDEYRRYVRCALRRRTDGVRSGNSAYEDASRRARRAVEARDAAAAERARLARELEANEEAQAALAAEIRALEGSPEMRDARELDRARDEAARSERVRDEAVAEATRAADQEERAFEEHERLAARAESIATGTRRALAKATMAAEAADFVGVHGPAVAELAAGSVSPEAIEAARRALDRSVETRNQAIRLLRELERRRAEAERWLADAERRLEEASSALAAAREAEQAARRAMEESAERLLADLRRWHGAARALVLPDVEALADAFESWVYLAEGENPFHVAAGIARREADRAVARDEDRVRTRRRELDERMHALDAEVAALEQGVHIPPPEPHVRRTPREGRVGAPLWKLCDFREGVSPAARAGFEAALEASGLLDAWVGAEGVLLDPETEDAILDPHRPAGAEVGPERLDRWLEPRIDASDPAASAVSAGAISRILAAIGAAPESGEHWVSEDGSWRLGPLRGRWSKPEAEHVGEAARAEARRRRIATLRAEREVLACECDELEARLRELEERSLAIDEEHAAIPSEVGLRRATDAVGQRVRDVARLLELLEEAEGRSAEARVARDGALRARDADAADLGLARWVERLDELGEAFTAYCLAIAPVWSELHRSVDAEREARASAERLETAAVDHASRAERRREADRDAAAARSRYETLESSVGATAKGILERLAAAARRLEEARTAARVLAEDERRKFADHEVALRDIERWEEERARFGRERDAAIGRLLDLARERLFGEADAALAELDGDAEWATTRAVEIARRAEDLLVDAPSGADDWRRRQEAIHPHTARLRDRLGSHGYPLDEHLLDDVVVVRCPFQGRACTTTELAATLAEDLAARTRLLDEKEREVIENHLLGEVVLELQKLVEQGETWVEATNGELASRPTSTGMLLRFRWEPDPEGPAGLDAVRRQLLRTRELWTPEERRGLAEFLQARIREAREADEVGAWRELLASALDYRRWHRFAIERNQEGQWRRLTRRTYGTGSGGEKALALTLPQFAAAAAHYQSADPLAPRLILLDEAFVGIDADMRAKCMGLLASFDLDFVMTSEREWGCYPTLPGLAIYQLSSRPGVDAVVSTRWVWNGSERVRAPSLSARPAPMPWREDPAEQPPQLGFALPGSK